MADSQGELLALFLGIVVTCGVTLLPIRVRDRRSPLVYLPLAPVLLYIAYETLIWTRYPEVNIRVDLLILLPLLAAALVRGWKRWVDVGSGAPLQPAPGLAGMSLAMGVVGILLFSSFLFSAAAVVAGHIWLRRLRTGGAKGGRGLAQTGVVLGYLGLALGVGSLLVVLMADS